MSDVDRIIPPHQIPDRVPGEVALALVARLMGELARRRLFTADDFEFIFDPVCEHYPEGHHAFLIARVWDDVLRFAAQSGAAETEPESEP